MGGPKCLGKMCKQDNIDLLHYITTGMYTRGIKYWLDFGGLLGVIREGDMIEGDDDLDICITTSEIDKVDTYFDNLANNALCKYYVKRSKNIICRQASSLYQVRPKCTNNKALLDIFVFEDDSKEVLKSRWTSKDDTYFDTIFPLNYFYVEKWGFSVNIPNNPTLRLTEKYGEDFMIPNSKKQHNRFKRGYYVLNRCMKNKLGVSPSCFFIVTLFFIKLTFAVTKKN